MPVISEKLGSGWLALDEQPTGSLEPDTLRLRMYATTPYTTGIHVPRSIDEQVGELIATILRSGERISLGEGMIVSYNGGIRILDPYEVRRSRLRVHVIIDLRDFVALRFVTHK